HLERIPTAGERVVIDGLEVKIERASRRRIHEVRINRQRAVPPEAPPDLPGGATQRPDEMA
ncbi:MAG: hypothetical protein KDI64_11545, partial [Candidatus Accumulibacter sp.]|nr:hypothetical protein [Accumulibacter sp.]